MQCCDDCCPEAIQTINIDESTTEIEGAAITLTPSQINAQKWSVAAQVSVAANYKIDFWFVDSPQADAAKSMVPPDVPGVIEWTQITDANGLITVVVEHAGAKTVYLCASLGAGVVVSSALTFV